MGAKEEGRDSRLEDNEMKLTLLDTMYTIVNRINLSGCRVVAPFNEPSMLKILFDGYFGSAAYIPSYPSTLYIYGAPGQIAVSSIADVEQISSDKYVIRYGENSHFSDIMVQIVE